MNANEIYFQMSPSTIVLYELDVHDSGFIMSSLKRILAQAKTWHLGTSLKLVLSIDKYVYGLKLQTKDIAWPYNILNILTILLPHIIT